MNLSKFRDWKRFSLRTLLLFMTVCCLLLGVWSYSVEPFRRQAASLAMVKDLKGGVETVPADGTWWQRWLVTTLVGPDSYVYATSVSLEGRSVDDEDLRALDGLVHLRELNLDRTHLTDEGMTALEDLQGLNTLSLKFTNVSDQSAEVLVSLSGLDTLYLTGTHITDDAIPKLAKLQTLRELYVRWTRMSDSGAERLRAAMPNCSVYYHSLLHDETQMEERVGDRL